MKNSKFIFLSVFAMMQILVGCSNPETTLEEVSISSTPAPRYHAPASTPLDSLLLIDDSCRVQLHNELFTEEYPSFKNIIGASLTTLNSKDFFEDVLSSASILGLLDAKDSLALISSSVASTDLFFYLYSMPNKEFAIVRPYRGALKVVAYMKGNTNSSLDLFTNYYQYAHTVSCLADSVAAETDDYKYACIHRRIASVHGVGKEDLMTLVNYTELMLNQFFEIKEFIETGKTINEYFDGVVNCDIVGMYSSWSQDSPYNTLCSTPSLVGGTPLCIAKLLLYEYGSIKIGDKEYTSTTSPSITSLQFMRSFFSEIQKQTSTILSTLYPLTSVTNGLLYLTNQGFTLTITNRTASLATKASVITNSINNNHPVIAIYGNKWYLIEGYRRHTGGYGVTTSYLLNNNAVLGNTSQYVKEDFIKNCKIVTYTVENDIH